MLIRNLFYLSFQTCPVDLTRSLEHNNKHNSHHHRNGTSQNSSDTECEIPTKRLAFSVENILDPNKFTGKKAHHNTSFLNNNNNRIWSGFERDDTSRDRYDDDQSELHSGELNQPYCL